MICYKQEVIIIKKYVGNIIQGIFGLAVILLLWGVGAVSHHYHCENFEIYYNSIFYYLPNIVLLAMPVFLLIFAFIGKRYNFKVLYFSALLGVLLPVFGFIGFCIFSDDGNILSWIFAFTLGLLLSPFHRLAWSTFDGVWTGDQYADEDGESSAEDVTRDDTTDPAKIYFDEWRANAVFARYEKLDIRERSMIADHLGFCRECHGVLENGTDENGEKIILFRQKKAYADLALQHTLSSPDTAYRIVHKAYDKILLELAVDEYIHIVELRCTKKTKTEIIYEYCADHNNDWGEIRYTPGNNEYDVTRYVYADKKGGFFFAAAGDWIVRQASKEQFPQTAVIPITKI